MKSLLFTFSLLLFLSHVAEADTIQVGTAPLDNMPLYSTTEEQAAVASKIAQPQSGDTVRIGDFNYVVVSQRDWADLTNKVATCCETWAKLNATESGRTALHGSRGHTTITNGQITVEYADGYRRTEDVPRKAKAKGEGGQRKKPTASTVTVRRNLPARLEEIMNRREKLKNAKPLEITVEETGGEK